jgi:hypothetical protein
VFYWHIWFLHCYTNHSKYCKGSFMDTAKYSGADLFGGLLHRCRPLSVGIKDRGGGGATSYYHYVCSRYIKLVGIYLTDFAPPPKTERLWKRLWLVWMDCSVMDWHTCIPILQATSMILMRPALLHTLWFIMKVCICEQDSSNCSLRILT